MSGIKCLPTEKPNRCRIGKLEFNPKDCLVKFLFCSLPFGLISAFASISAAAFLEEYEDPPIYYSKAATDNIADALNTRFHSGEFAPESWSRQRQLSAFLKELEIPEETQTLVFSKTSLQRDGIHPRRPRALYFSDDHYMGYVQGGLFELTVTDPKLGLVFYAVDPRKRAIQRSQDCLGCHGGPNTDYWPGVFIRSVVPDEDGEFTPSAGSKITEHSSPMKERWGGWYVTGKHGDQRHMGNAFAKETINGPRIDTEDGANLTDLSDFFDSTPYLRPDSDIVALMVLEHQCEMHNRLSRAMLRTRKWMAYQKSLNEALNAVGVEDSEPTGTAKMVMDSETERVVEYLLFCGEERLPFGGVEGAGDFEVAFRENRREDAKGRSLKDFELKRRLFEYRCSYMIYSKIFDYLSPELKTSIYRRLFEVLQAEELPEKYAHLRPNERLAIQEILLETKPEISEFLGSK